MEPMWPFSMAVTGNSSADPLSTPTPALPASDLIDTIIPPFIFALSATGILGNSFVLLVFLLHRGRWSIAEIYLGNLALADLVLLACLPFWAVAILRGYDWPFGLCLCKAVNLSVVVNFYASVYMLAMVSVDRYLALVKTMQAQWLRRTRYAKAVCLSLWGFGVLMGVPTVIARKVKYVYGITACVLDYPDPSWKLAHEVLMVVVGFILPVLVIVFCSCSIFRTLDRRREGVSAQGGAAGSRKPTVLVYSVTLLFLLCWGPFQLFTLLGLLYDAGLLDKEAWLRTLHLGDQVSIYLAFLNSALNPVLYVFSGQYFRRKVGAIWWRFRHGGRRGSDMTMYQRSMVSTYLQRTEQQIKPVVI